MSTADTTQSSPFDRIRLRHVALGTAVVVLVALAFWLAALLRYVLMTVFLGIVLATALRPVVARLREGHMPRYVAASAALLLLILGAAGIGVLIVPLVIDQGSALSQLVPEAYASLREELVNSPYRVVRQFGRQFSEPQPVPEGTTAQVLAAHAGEWLPQVGYVAFLTLSVLAVTYYWLLYRERSIRELLLLLPMEQREGIEAVWLRIEERLGGFLRGQVILALATGGLSLAGYWLVGTPFPLLMALIAGLLELVPYVGPFIAGGVATAIAFTVSPAVGLGTLIVAIIIQQAENIYLAPRVMDKTVGVAPVVTLLAFVGFAALFGWAGVLLAIPLAATLQVLFSEWMQRRAGAMIEEPVQGRSRLDRLRYQLRDLAQDLHRHIRTKEVEVARDADRAEEEIEQVLSELEGLIGQANNGSRP